MIFLHTFYTVKKLYKSRANNKRASISEEFQKVKNGESGTGAIFDIKIESGEPNNTQNIPINKRGGL